MLMAGRHFEERPVAIGGAVSFLSIGYRVCALVPRAGSDMMHSAL